jgi:hypothetical protein
MIITIPIFPIDITGGAPQVELEKELESLLIWPIL